MVLLVGSSFGADVDAPPGAGFAVNVFLRDGDKVYRTWHTNGRGTEQLSHSFALIDLLPWGRQEEWQDSPDGWPQEPTYSRWLDSPDVAALYGPKGLTGGIGVRGWWWLRRRPCAPAGGDHRGELDGVPSGAARASTSRARSSSGAGSAGGPQSAPHGGSPARCAAGRPRRRRGRAARTRLHPLRGRPQPALGGAAGVGLLGRGVRGLRGPPVGVVPGGLPRSPGPGRRPARRRRRAQLPRLAAQLVVLRAQAASSSRSSPARLTRPRRVRRPPARHAVLPPHRHGRGGLYLPPRRPPRRRPAPRRPPRRPASPRRAPRWPPVPAAPAAAARRTASSGSDRPARPRPAPAARPRRPAPGRPPATRSGVGLAARRCATSTAATASLLHLVETRRHGVQRRGQLRRGGAHRVDVLAQPVGVQPERGAAAVEPQRVEASRSWRAICAHVRRLPPRVAAEGSWAAALRAGDGGLGRQRLAAAAAVSITRGVYRFVPPET